MRQITFNTYSLLLCLGLLFCSCSKEEALTPSNNYQAAYNSAEVFLATYNVPEVMFSYNVLNTQTNTMQSIFIDDEGKVRKHERETSVVDHQSFIPENNLSNMKSNAEIVPDIEVDIEDMVSYFKQLRTSDKLSYDLSVETEESKIVTAVYGYYFYIEEGSDDHEDCERNSSSLSLYRPILLEQKLDASQIQLNPSTRSIATWVNTISEGLITVEDSSSDSN